MTWKGWKPVRAVSQDLRSVLQAGSFSDPLLESMERFGLFLLPGIEFLPKPYGPASLARRVREALDRV